MEIITFTAATAHSNLQAFLHYAEKELKPLMNDQFKYEFILRASNQICLTCHQWPEHISLSDVIDTFRHYFSTGVAEFIVEELEPKLVKHMLQKEYHYTRDKRAAIFNYCQQMLYFDEETSKNDLQKIEERKCKIYIQAYGFLAEERVFDLSGFLQFRLQSYLRDLKAVLEFAIEEYILDQEYQEFIRLLRYFISTQETKVSLIHVLHMEGQHFLIYNENKEEITEEEIEAHLQDWAGQKILYEGMMISTLISMAPQNIVVHTVQADLNVISTLQNVFNDRLLICTSCSDCIIWRKKEVENNQIKQHT